MMKRQEIKIGTIIVVQTHGRSGQYNPHLHMLMTNGGINEGKEKWVDLNYFPYEIIHKKWQYHLLKMLEKGDRGGEIQGLITKLWKDYSNGFVAHIKKGNIPELWRGLARYLAKYVACPPIAVRRIMNYDGKNVTYCPGCNQETMEYIGN